MQQAGKLYVVGIGYKPFGQRARDVVNSADAIIASRRLAEVFERYDEFVQVKDRVRIINNVDETMAFIGSSLRNPKSTIRNIVLLASGDPMFFGIGRRVIEEFGRDGVEILPDLSSVQEAFARINEPWDDAFLISLHGGPDPAKRRKLKYELRDIPSLLDQHYKIAILTDKENNPAAIAGVLQSAIQNPRSEIVLHVCERLGYPDEKVTQGAPAEMAGKTFSEPSVVVLMKDEGRIKKEESGKQRTDHRFGLREDEILHERGLITKDEVRAVTLHKLRLPRTGVLWDIGAGSGSVSIEAARLCPGLRVIAIEKDQERINTIRENVRQFGLRNVDIILGTAPESLDDLAAPVRVFIGGSGGKIAEIIKIVNGRMVSGIIVINAVTLKTLNEALPALENNGFAVEVSEVLVSRSKITAGKRQMTALNPITVVRGEKGE